MGRIFISYRREDAAADANALYQSLSSEFGSDQLFKDVDNVALGANWKTAVRDAVRASSVVLVVIGRSWEFTGAIRIELETALEEGVKIIPLLVGGAKIEEVAGALDGRAAVLAELNAASLDHSSWSRDLAPVVKALRTELGGEEEASGDPTAPNQVHEPAPASGPVGSGDWTAELTEVESGLRLKIVVELNNSGHTIAWKARAVLPGGIVTVDGVEVSRGLGVSRELHTFELLDGDVSYVAKLEVLGVMNPSVKLTVAGRELLTVAPPAPA